MDQEKCAGHHAVTQSAVNQLFESATEKGTIILGRDSEAFFKELDRWQHYADRIVGGDTWHHSDYDPDAQRRHSMADPNKTGDQNLRDIRAFVSGSLYLAQVAHNLGKPQMEWQRLGAAVHALEDSFSNAHVFRDPTKPADPHASIEAFNNFSPWTSHQTHDSTFDKVPITEGKLERRSDQAAAAAVAEMLSSYLEHINDEPSKAYTAFTDTVSKFFQGKDVHVLKDKHDSEYLAQREVRYENEVCRAESGGASTPPSQEAQEIQARLAKPESYEGRTSDEQRLNELEKSASTGDIRDQSNQAERPPVGSENESRADGDRASRTTDGEASASNEIQELQSRLAKPESYEDRAADEQRLGDLERAASTGEVRVPSNQAERPPVGSENEPRAGADRGSQTTDGEASTSKRLGLERSVSTSVVRVSSNQAERPPVGSENESRPYGDRTSTSNEIQELQSRLAKPESYEDRAADEQRLGDLERAVSTGEVRVPSNQAERPLQGSEKELPVEANDAADGSALGDAGGLGLGPSIFGWNAGSWEPPPRHQGEGEHIGSQGGTIPDPPKSEGPEPGSAAAAEQAREEMKKGLSRPDPQEPAAVRPVVEMEVVARETA